MPGRPAETVIQKSITEKMTIFCADDMHNKCRKRRLTARGWDRCYCPCHDEKVEESDGETTR